MYGYNYARMEDSKAVGALYAPTKNYYFQRAWLLLAVLSWLAIIQ